MTCIAGVVRDGEVWIGVDSFTGCGDTFFARKDPKIFRHSGLLLGHAGNFRVAQIIKHCVPEMESAPECSAESFLIREFVPSVRAALDQHGGREAEGGREFQGAILIATRGRLFELGGDFALHEHGEYGAIGTGEDVANGALFCAWEHFKALGGYNIVHMALRAAASHCASVCPPFHIEKL